MDGWMDVPGIILNNTTFYARGFVSNVLGQWLSTIFIMDYTTDYLIDLSCNPINIDFELFITKTCM